jgi:hypothetical protein
MSYLPQPSEGGDFIPPPSGSHIAICSRVIDIGTQTTEYQGETKKQHKIIITWELPAELMDDNRPFTISQRYTWSMHEKAKLRQDLESWRGRAFTEENFLGGAKPFDIKNIIGQACLLSIVHAEKNGRTYANIRGVAGLPKGTRLPDPINPATFLWLSSDLFDKTVLDGLSERMQEIIKGCPEYKTLLNGNGSQDDPPLANPDDYGANDLNDEVPF